MTLTPFMESALFAMRRGALERQSDGWRSATIRGLWNSHTIGWMAERGLCRVIGGQATITRDGKAALVQLGAMAAA